MIIPTANTIALEYIKYGNFPGIRRAYFSGFVMDIREFVHIGILMAELEDGDKAKIEITLRDMDITARTSQRELQDGVRGAIDAALRAIVARHQKKLTAPLVEIS